MTNAFSLSRRNALRAAAAAPLLVLAPYAQAKSDYPSKTIEMFVGYPPGGSVDQMGRVMAEAMARHLNASIVVNNMGGASGAIGAQHVVNSAPNGYTLLAASNNELVGTKLINPGQRYDALKDFTPIGLVAAGPVIFAAGPRSGVKTLPELIAKAKANPGKMSYGSSGVGTMLNFSGELFKQMAGVDIVHVPYRGVAPEVTDLVGGTLDLAMISPTAALPFVKSGQIAPLAVTSAKRIASLPDVPAMGEIPALKGYEMLSWFAIMAPRRLPDDIRAALTAALQQSLLDKSVREPLEATGMEMATGHEDVTKLLEVDSAKYAKIAKASGMLKQG